LAGSLIESLDATVDEAAEAAWNQEIARRIEDLDSGKAKIVPPGSSSIKDFLQIY
jgi:Putative addiction module component